MMFFWPTLGQSEICFSSQFQTQICTQISIENHSTNSVIFGKSRMKIFQSLISTGLSLQLMSSLKNKKLMKILHCADSSSMRFLFVLQRQSYLTNTPSPHCGNQSNSSWKMKFFLTIQSSLRKTGVSNISTILKLMIFLKSTWITLSVSLTLWSKRKSFCNWIMYYSSSLVFQISLEILIRLLWHTHSQRCSLSRNRMQKCVRTIIKWS